MLLTQHAVDIASQIASCLMYKGGHYSRDRRQSPLNQRFSQQLASKLFCLRKRAAVTVRENLLPRDRYKPARLQFSTMEPSKRKQNQKKTFRKEKLLSKCAIVSSQRVQLNYSKYETPSKDFRFVKMHLETLLDNIFPPRQIRLRFYFYIFIYFATIRKLKNTETKNTFLSLFQFASH